MLFSTARILEHSIAAQNDERMRQERVANIKGASSPVRRGIARVALNFATNRPDQASNLLDGIARLRGLEYVGTGIEYTVYRERSTDEAIKIHRESADMTPNAQVELLAQVKTNGSILGVYLGGAAVEQSVEIGPHVFGGYNTVQVRQPFQHFTDADAPFTVNQPEVDLPKLETLVRNHPGAPDALREFIERSRQMHYDAALLPDTNGRHNVIVDTDDNVVLIDTTPIATDIAYLARTRDNIMSQLYSLEIGLSEVA